MSIHSDRQLWTESIAGRAERQVEAAAVRKYGSLDNMELHHEQQQMAKTKKHIAKRKEESQRVLAILTSRDSHWLL